MDKAIVVHGRLEDSTHLVLDEPVTEVRGEVEVVLRAAAAPGVGADVFDFIAKLPAGNRSKDDIDRQIRAERDAWDR